MAYSPTPWPDYLIVVMVQQMYLSKNHVLINIQRNSVAIPDYLMNSKFVNVYFFSLLIRFYCSTLQKHKEENAEVEKLN